jgi:hypothetical protein
MYRPSSNPSLTLAADKALTLRAVAAVRDKNMLVVWVWKERVEKRKQKRKSGKRMKKVFSI